MEKFTEFLNDKEAFVAAVKRGLESKAMSEMDELKKSIAADVLLDEEDESE